MPQVLAILDYVNDLWYNISTFNDTLKYLKLGITCKLFKNRLEREAGIWKSLIEWLTIH